MAKRRKLKKGMALTLGIILFFTVYYFAECLRYNFGNPGVGFNFNRFELLFSNYKSIFKINNIEII